MFRLCVCALGMAGILTFAAVAHADEPVDEAEKTKRIEVKLLEPVEVERKSAFKILNADGEPIDKRVRIEVDGKVIEFDGDDFVVAKDAAKKARVLADRFLDDMKYFDWQGAFEDAVNGLEDVQVTIRMPDGTTRSFGGKQAEGMAPLRGRVVMPRFRYGPGKANAPQDLAQRLKRLEDENRRMRHEIELMRRRLNELAGEPAKPEPLRRWRMRDSDRAKRSTTDDRLGRIEDMLRSLLQKERVGDFGRSDTFFKRAKDARKARAKADKRTAEIAIKRAKMDAERAVKLKRAKEAKERVKSTRQIEEMIEHSRKRIEELMRKLDEEKKRLNDSK